MTLQHENHEAIAAPSLASVHPPMAAVREAVARALAEDLMPLGDLTASLLVADVYVVGHLVARTEGVLAGRLCANEVFASVDADIKVTWQVDDGEEVVEGRVVALVEGRLASIVTAERTALNFLCHLSGVATLTRHYVQAVAAGHHQASIRDTRKTTPGLRALEKAAVRAGGGVNHRGSLSDGILVKDNHLGGLSIAKAVEQARRYWPGRSVEVECDRLEQVTEAMAAGADLVLCDNMTPSQVAEAVALASLAERACGGHRCLIEVSGGVSLATVGAYAEVGAHLIAVGALTHSAPALDFGLDLPELVPPPHPAPVL